MIRKTIKKTGESRDDMNQKYAGPTFSKAPDARSIPRLNRNGDGKDTKKAAGLKDLFRNGKLPG